MANKGKKYAVGIDAGQDSSGNPRRGWFVYSPSGHLEGFLEEGYNGAGFLHRVFPNAVELINRIPVKLGYYRDALHDVQLDR
jgi:hypothetical protein